MTLYLIQLKMLHRDIVTSGDVFEMLKRFFLAKPIGLKIVGVAFWLGLALVVAASVQVWLLQSAGEGFDLVALLTALVTLICGSVLLRCLIEVILTLMEIRDKLGAIERNTLHR